MENKNQNQKLITISFVVLAMLVWFVMGVLLDTFAATWGVVRRLTDKDVVRHGIPVVTSLALFFGLQFNPKVMAWADGVVLELRKVVWPSRKDTTAMTAVVCVMLLVSGVVFGVFDFFSNYIVNFMVE